MPFLPAKISNLLSTMSAPHRATTPDAIVQAYYPDGVSRILATGGSNYIGFVDKYTVLKFPHKPEDLGLLESEAGIYAALGSHHRILQFKGKTKHGLLLSFASNGSLAALLQKSQFPTTFKLKWALQASEAVAYIHLRNVLHCDLNATNFLLDDDFNLLLCDFQGRLLHLDGSICIDGGVSENAKSRMPGKADDEADTKTDIFALGSTIYHIIQGHQPFPDFDTFDDEIVIRSRFESREFPPLACSMAGLSEIIYRCWEGTYTSAKQVCEDLENISHQVTRS